MESSIENVNDIIYVFFHIPKTAGLTFRYHIKKNFRESEILIISFKAVGLDGTNPPNDEKIYRKAVFSYLKSLDCERLKSVKVIYGHLVHFGIDRFFRKKLRYFTFVREPVRRVVSLYNHMYTLYEHSPSKEELGFLKRSFILDGHIPSFDTWFRKKYLSKRWNKYLSISGYLQLHGFLSKRSFKDNKFNEIEKKFYFVGMVKSFSKDSLFLYERMGIRKYFLDENLSIKYKKLDSDDPAYDLILRNVRRDLKLFTFVEKINRGYSIRYKDYKSIVENAGRRRRLLLPITSILFSPRRTVRNVIYLQLRKR